MERLGSAFVGREREMTELKASLEDAFSGRGRLVMLVGEPGIGKTRTAQERDAQVLWGWCYEEQGAPPYWPWTQPIRSYIQDKDIDQLRSEMGPGAADIAEVVPQVRDKLPDIEPPPALEPESARFRLFDSIATFLRNASRNRPLVLILDDLHWADRSSLLLLEFLAHEIAKSRLLVVGAYRDVELSRRHPLTETLAELARGASFQRVLLRGLDQQETERLIQANTEAELPQGIVQTVYSQTEGNPFFVTEIASLLGREGELWDIRIPEGVREVIGRRLNRLSERCNRVLTVASVIGREFDFKLLSVLNDISEGQLLEVIEEALNARVIEEAVSGAERYQFSHALIRQTLYEEITTSRRVRLHARIGEALEKLHRTNVEPHASELAYHFSEAEPVTGAEKLVRCSLMAGEQALVAYAWEEALPTSSEHWPPRKASLWILRLQISSMVWDLLNMVHLRDLRLQKE